MENRNVLNYTLLRLLGRGGMAEVWYAENEIGNEAAVKILNEDLSHNAQIVERFRNEAKITVKLKHPNIRQVYDYATIDGRPCMIMEYLEGSDLKSMLKSGRRFNDGELRRWWNQLASALNYTHGKGVVHRDIKPANIFIDHEGNVKLLDFGIAKVRDSITMTQTGATMGTLMYMSPEQVRDSKHIDHSTDLYSLAVTFVHLLKGVPPYDFDTTDDYEIRKNIVETPLDMTGVPSDWQKFLRPYLAKNPAERPALAEFGIERAVPSSNPISDETVVGGSTPAKDADDEGTIVAGIPSAQSQPGYVDLGLPSGTKWRDMNEEGFYTYDEAVQKFGSQLPTKAQYEELLNHSTWKWMGNGYEVKGPNGNKIYLPAAGFRDCNYDVFCMESSGNYWSSTPYNSGNAWYLYLLSDYHNMDDYECYQGHSVRLVQSKSVVQGNKKTPEVTQPKKSTTPPAPNKKSYYLEVDYDIASVYPAIIYDKYQVYNITPDFIKRGYRFVKWEDHSREKKSFGNTTYDGYYKAVFEEVWWHKFRWYLIGTAAAILVALIILLVNILIPTGTLIDPTPKHSEDPKPATEETVIPTDTPTPVDDPKELKKQEIREAFWALYKTDKRTKDKWNNLYKQYKNYNQNPYVKFLQLITINNAAFNKFKNLTVTIPESEYNDIGLEKLQKAYTSAVTTTAPATTSAVTTNDATPPKVNPNALFSDVGGGNGIGNGSGTGTGIGSGSGSGWGTGVGTGDGGGIGYGTDNRGYRRSPDIMLNVSESGSVYVEVEIDESGNVIAAKVISNSKYPTSITSTAIREECVRRAKSVKYTSGKHEYRVLMFHNK